MIDSIVGNLSLSKNGFILLLRPRQETTGRMLPILIGVAEAQSIALALARKHTPRPMTHDLMKGLLDTLGVSLKRVEIIRFEGKTFFAQLRLSRGGEELAPVDARPSDAIALALRCSAPIRVAAEIYEKAGIDLPEEAATAPAQHGPRRAVRHGAPPRCRGRPVRNSSAPRDVAESPPPGPAPRAGRVRRPGGGEPRRARDARTRRSVPARPVGAARASRVRGTAPRVPASVPPPAAQPVATPARARRESAP